MGFKHTKAIPTGITSVNHEDDKVAHVAWFSINGKRLVSEPQEKGVYIKKILYSNGKSVVEKHCKNL